jgi:hypothetical protein
MGDHFIHVVLMKDRMTLTSMFEESLLPVSIVLDNSP